MSAPDSETFGTMFDRGIARRGTALAEAGIVKAELRTRLLRGAAYRLLWLSVYEPVRFAQECEPLPEPPVDFWSGDDEPHIANENTAVVEL